MALSRPRVLQSQQSSALLSPNSRDIFLHSLKLAAELALRSQVVRRFFFFFANLNNIIDLVLLHLVPLTTFLTCSFCCNWPANKKPARHFPCRCNQRWKHLLRLQSSLWRRRGGVKTSSFQCWQDSALKLDCVRPQRMYMTTLQCQIRVYTHWAFVDVLRVLIAESLQTTRLNMLLQTIYRCRRLYPSHQTCTPVTGQYSILGNILSWS